MLSWIPMSRHRVELSHRQRQSQSTPVGQRNGQSILSSDPSSSGLAGAGSEVQTAASQLSKEVETAASELKEAASELGKAKIDTGAVVKAIKALESNLQKQIDSLANRI